MAERSTFVFGDIHGCAAELRKLLDKLPLRKNSRLVFLGDYVDRGPDSKGVIDTLLKLGKNHEVVALKGNHEDMLIHFLSHPESAESALFILNGGSATLASYSSGEGSFHISNEHLEFYTGLQLLHRDEENVYVHAGLPIKPLAEIDSDDESELLWIRQPFLSSKFDWGLTVVHGHTPADEVEVKTNRINLDTGCVYGGYLSAMEFPARKIYRVKKAGPAAHTYLRDEHSQRIAHRFSGAIQVFIDHESGVAEFTTLNYNEFGMLIRPRDEKKSPVFRNLDRIRGTIGARDQRHVDFQGQIVRVDARGPFNLYGVKITQLASLPVLHGE